MICQSGRSFAVAHRAVLEIAMATIGGAGSATAMIIAFSLESILGRVCLVDHRGLLVRCVRVLVHAALCPWRAINFQSTPSSEFRAAKILSLGGDYR